MSIFTFLPSAKTDPLEEFRTLCREFAQPQSAPEIKKILFVGANYDERDLGYKDKIFLRRIILCAQQWGINISENFELTPLNIAHSPSQDFIDPELNFSADLVSINFISKFSQSMRGAYIDPRSHISHANMDSPYHIYPTAWCAALEKSGAKLAITFGDDFWEVTTRNRVSSSLYAPIHIPENDPKAYKHDAMEAILRKDLVSFLIAPKVWTLNAGHGTC